MPKLPYADVSLDVDTGTERRRTEVEADTPFRILLMGDFSGRGHRGEPPVERLRPLLIDRDNFDQVLGRTRPELELGAAGNRTVMWFRELEDFHPDRIYAREAMFKKLRETRSKLADPATFHEAAEQVKGWSAHPAKAPERVEPGPPPPTLSLSSGDLLGSILDADDEAFEGGSGTAPRRQTDDLQEFIDRAVKPHLEARADPQLPELMAEVDASAGRLMRALLHHRDFQALEAGWRAVDWLVRGLETGTFLKVYTVDVSKAELAGALPELRRILVDETSVRGSEPWALVAGNFTFARTEEDIALLKGLGRVMRAAGAPFLAEADPSEPESERAAAQWDALRHSPEAAWIGLALPRFLLRLPYGAKTDPVESFAFEETPGAPAHSDYLWANPAFACTYLLGEAFGEDGWDLRPGSHLEIRGLPLHVYEAGGETCLQPCAELLMTEEGADAIMEQGFMALASLKGQDAARLVRFQSIAEPAGGLGGRWR